MFRNPKTHVLLAFGAALAFVGCTKENPDGLDGGTNPYVVHIGADGGPNDDAAIPLEFPESAKAALRFKRTDRIRNDFSQALALNPAMLCREFGQYSCTDAVHSIALGGVEPYVLGLREPLEFTTVTTPIAVERVAFAGCEQRVSQDLADPQNAVIFRDLGIDTNGAIPNLDAAGVEEAIDTLYKRAVLRPPRATELTHLKQLYRDVEGTNEPGPARDWAILACFSVLTTMEALFY